MRKFAPMFALVLAMFVAVPALAQQAPVSSAPQQYTPPVVLKDPGTATLFGLLITGGGHFYAGETNKGLMLLGASAGSIVAGTVISAASVSNCAYDYYSDCSGSMAPMALGYLGALGVWVYGILDADDAAHRMNHKNGSRVQPVVSRGSNGGTAIGLSMPVGR